MADKTEAKIRQRAYELWEAEGRPEHRQHHHWDEAKREVESGQKAGNRNDARIKKTPGTLASPDGQSAGAKVPLLKHRDPKGGAEKPSAKKRTGMTKSAPA